MRKAGIAAAGVCAALAVSLASLADACASCPAVEFHIRNLTPSVVTLPAYSVLWP